jgi:hypothetical protein
MTIHSSRPGLERIRRETGTTHDPLHLVAAKVLAPVIIERCGVHRGMVRRLGRILQGASPISNKTLLGLTNVLASV